MKQFVGLPEECYLFMIGYKTGQEKEQGMGQRGEVFTLKRFAEDGELTYFFNVKENRYGDLFLNLVESRKQENRFQRYSLIVYSEDFKKFSDCLDTALSMLRAENPQWSSELKTGSGKRKYSFVIKTARNSQFYLVVSESRIGKNELYENVSIRIFKKNLGIFQEGYEKASFYMTK